MNYNEIIDSFIENLDNDQNTLYFFKGFTVEFYTYLLGKKQFPRFVEREIFDVFKEVSDTKQLISAIMDYKGGTSWGTYEEFIEIAQKFNDLSHVYDGKIVIISNNLFEGYFPSFSTDETALMESFSERNTVDTPYNSLYSDVKEIEKGILVQYILKHENRELGIIIDERGMFEPGATIDLSFSEQVQVMPFQLNDIIYSSLLGNMTSKRFFINLPNNTEIEYRIKILNHFFANAGVSFQIGIVLGKTKADEPDNHLSYFKKHWGEDKNYRSAKFYSSPDLSLDTIEISQGKIISDVLAQCRLSRNAQGRSINYSDIIVTAPTGAGKSLFFQVPGIVLHEKYNEVTIVVTPLQALMKDQVEKLTDERGVKIATFINAEISFDERRRRLQGIRNGMYSIVYLSPELLLSSSIEDLIGDRRLGLFVVDEAHLVTSWGRDFRVEYWFLGGYIEKIRNGGYYIRKENVHFPVLILTATAIYGGEYDEIGELITSLNLSVDTQEHMYIGYGRKENIVFNIKQEFSARSDKEQKEQLVIERIKQFVKKREKTIVYCPFTSQVDSLYHRLLGEGDDIYPYVGRYHSKQYTLPSTEKNNNYQDFKENRKTVMIATKAFGMGIDIDDINNVYHYAPTGTLADYVQEIGRAARQLDEGYALLDFILGKDMGYARTLWGLGGLKQYQLKEIANVLVKMWRRKGNNNILISPESFSHIFDNKSLNQQVKSGLMLLTSDLEAKFHFKAMTIRPKSIYTSQYILIDDDIKEAFEASYSQYAKRLFDPTARKESKHGYHREVSITLKGSIYEIDLGKLWEDKFNDMTFPMFKRQLFTNSLFDFSSPVIPKMKIIIDYSHYGYDITKNKMIEISNKLQKTFLIIQRNYNKREFTFEDFYQTFSEQFVDDQKPKREFVKLLLNLFVFEGTSFDTHHLSPWKFIQPRKKDRTENDASYEGSQHYKLISNRYSKIAMCLQRYISDAVPNKNEHEYVSFVNVPDRYSESTEHDILLSSILQLFELASFEIQGGRNAQIFVRLNDPLKLYQVVNAKRYTNLILQEIGNRHNTAITFMNKFLGTNFSSEKRWDIIENFFLGRDEEVQNMLDANTPPTTSHSPKISKTKIISKGIKFKEFYKDWTEYDSEYSIYDELGIPIPEYLGAEIEVALIKYNLDFFWDKQKLGVLTEGDNWSSPGTELNTYEIIKAEDLNPKILLEKLGG